jgi:hypothetical protein
MHIRSCLLILACMTTTAMTVTLNAQDAPTPSTAASGDTSQTITTWKAAVAGSDPSTIRAALKQVLALGPAVNEQVLPILVQAVGLATTHDIAVETLRQRTGLQPGLHNFGTGYPNYPLSDATADWNSWLQQRSQDLAKQHELDDHQRRIDKLEQQQQAAPLSTH